MMPLVKNDSQSFGSILSYARRYSLSAMAGIPAVDDDSESAMIRVDKIDTNMIDLISDLIEKTESDIEKFCTVFNVPSINKMTMVQAEKALAMLERKNAK